jgi:hypothetical protein
MLLTVMWLALVSGGFTAGASSGGASPLTTKGDLYTYSTADDRLGVGADGLCLKALAANPTGLEWGACAAGGSGLTYAETAAANLGGF